MFRGVHFLCNCSSISEVFARHCKCVGILLRLRTADICGTEGYFRMVWRWSFG